MRKRINSIVKFFLKFSSINALTVCILNTVGYAQFAKRIELMRVGSNSPVSFDVDLYSRGKILMLPSYQGFVDQITHQNYIYGWSSFEKPLPFIVLHLMEKNTCFVDVGANTGFYSLLASFHEGNKVIGFEPFPPVFSCLQENIRINDKSNQIEAFQLALSDEVGSSELFIPNNDHGLIETSASLNQDFKDNHEKIVHVDVKTLDMFFSENQIESIDLIKIDVESFEQQVLAGAINSVKNCRPIIILEILNNDNIGWFKQFLSVNDYVAFSIQESIVENNHLSINPFQPNFIFCPQEKVSEIQAIDI